MSDFVRTPDNLRSEDRFEVILALGEGQIEGLGNGVDLNNYATWGKAILIGETPLLNPDLSPNFDDFRVDLYIGRPIPLRPLVSWLGGTASSLTVNVSLFYNVPVVRQLTVKNIDFVQCRFNVTSLYRQDDNGIYPHELQLRIRYKKSNESIWKPIVSPDVDSNGILYIKGKTTSTYIKEIRFDVTPDDTNYYQVEVTKFSPQTTSTESTDVAWESIQQVFAEKKTYYNTAIVQLMGRASNQFSNIPQFSTIVKGLIVKVPTNYDPVNRTYTGVWDGSFQLKYTTNPAWILYDFLTNTRYGMSYARPVNVDKFEVYEIAQWCDVNVSDGNSGLEPRFTFNGIIQEPRSAIDQARYLAGSFNATLFDDNNGTIILRADRNVAAKHIFTPENVEETGFQYSFTDLNARYNQINVSFINPELRWTEDRLTIPDVNAGLSQHQADYGIIPYDFVAQGCTKASEATRRAYYRLNTALTETMLVQFKTNRLGREVQPMDTILIGDPDLGYALTGRIKSLNPARTVITLRDALYLEFGITYTLSMKIPNTGIITRTITTPSTGSTTSLTLSSALPSNTPEYATFTLEQSAGVGVGAPKPFRVTKVSEVDGDPDLIEILAVEINRNKYEDSEALVESNPTQYSGLGDPADIPGPTNVTFTDVYSAEDNQIWTVLNVTLPRDRFRYYSGLYDVYSRPIVSGDPVGSFIQRTVFYGDTLVNHPPGLHEFKIVPKNIFNQAPPLAKMPSWNYTVGDKSTIGVKPDAVINLQLLPLPRGFKLTWDINPGQEKIVDHFLIKEGPNEIDATVFQDKIRDLFFVVDPMTKRGYNLWVYAVSKAGVVSDAVNITHANAAPQPPTNIHAEVAFETVMIFFDQMTEVDIVGYRIQFRKVGDNEYSDMDPSGLFDQGDPDTAYEFRVASQDFLTLTLNDEIWSTPISVRTRNTLGVQQGLDEVRSAVTPNLIRNGSFEQNLVSWSIVEGVAEALDDENARYSDPINGSAKILKIGDGVEEQNIFVSDRVVVRPLLKYSLGVDFLTDADDPGDNHYMSLRYYDADEELMTEVDQLHGRFFIDPEQLSTTEWVRLSTSFTIPDGAVWAEVIFVVRENGVLYVDGVQLQRGETPTAFNPHFREELSPEDLQIIVNPDSTPPGVPTALSASGSFRNIQLYWTSPGDSDLDYFEIWRSTTNDRDAAILVGSSISPLYADSITQTNVDFYYWVRAVDTSGNKGPFNAGLNAGVVARTIPITGADIQNLSIVNAQIANATIDDAKIANLSVSKLTAGTITTGNINIGNDRFQIQGNQTRLIVRDTLGFDRVYLGRLGSGAQDYGIQIFDASGNLILGATGLGVDVVGTGQIQDGSIVTDHIVSNAIDTDKLAANSVTATKIISGAITTNKLAAGAVTADKIAVADLSAISANLGYIQAGFIEAPGLSAATNFWCLGVDPRPVPVEEKKAPGEFKVGLPDDSAYIWLDPRENNGAGKLKIRGEVEFSSGTFDYDNLTNKPQNLSDINTAEGDKLSGIADGADVTANNTSANTNNVYNIPALNIANWANDPANRINSQVTTISGGKITTGSITADKINVVNLSAINASLGTIISGQISNGVLNTSDPNACYIDFIPSGGNPWFIFTKNFKVDKLGNFYASSGQLSGDLIVDGSITAGKLSGNAISDIWDGDSGVTVYSEPGDKFLIYCNVGDGSLSDSGQEIRYSFPQSLILTYGAHQGNNTSGLTRVFGQTKLVSVSTTGVFPTSSTSANPTMVQKRKVYYVSLPSGSQQIHIYIQMQAGYFAHVNSGSHIVALRLKK